MIKTGRKRIKKKIAKKTAIKKKVSKRKPLKTKLKKAKKKVIKRKPVKIKKKVKKTKKKRVKPTIKPAKTKKKVLRKKTTVKKSKKKLKKEKVSKIKVKSRSTKKNQVKKKTAKTKPERKLKKVKGIRGRKEFEEIEQTLLNQRAKLLKLISRSSTLEKDISKLDRGDLEDMAATSLEREMTFAIGSREREEFRMIGTALKKIANKSYGKCENCGENINVERLKIVPFAQYCMECKSTIEQEMESENLL
jgi:RNA polymerase-binding protein DksA